MKDKNANVGGERSGNTNKIKIKQGLMNMLP